MTTPDDKTLDDLVRRLRDVTQTGGLPDDDYEAAADAIAALRERIAALRQDAERFAKMLFASGAMDQVPCFFCGYNGAGYFTPEMHPCAARHHAALESEK